ncbi:MAG: hypothetical protein ACRYGK_11420 [Janthinobacterium lividum]
MSPEILIVHNSDGFHLMHGYLHLAVELDLHREITIDVRGEEAVKVSRSRDGFLVEHDNQQIPLIVTT